MRHTATLLFLALCLLTGSLWLLPFEPLPFPVELLIAAAGSTLVALAAGAAVLRNGSLSELLKGWSFALALNAVGAVGVPGLLLLLGRNRLNGIMQAAVLAGVPVLVAVALSFGDTLGESLQQLLLPALAALAGTLLVLPIALPQSASGGTGLLLYLLASIFLAFYGVACYRRTRILSLRVSFATMAFANALFYLLALVMVAAADRDGYPTEPMFSSRVLTSIALYAISEATLIVLIRLLPPFGFANRFVLATFIAAFEAYLLLHPTLAARSVFGAGLMLFGVITSLRGREPSSSPDGLSLR